MVAKHGTIPTTISLIGMPGAGKSTVGILLAKLGGLRFTDTDLDIQVREQATLQELLERDGYQRLRDIEEEILLAIDLQQTVVSTGGSVVYSERAMQRLRAAGPTVYLQVDLATLEQRVAAAAPRGIASSVAQTYAEVYSERTPLYSRHADLTIHTAGKTPDALATDILAQLSKDQGSGQ